MPSRARASVKINEFTRRPREIAKGRGKFGSRVFPSSSRNERGREKRAVEACPLHSIKSAAAFFSQAAGNFAMGMRKDQGPLAEIDTVVVPIFHIQIIYEIFRLYAQFLISRCYF